MRFARRCALLIVVLALAGMVSLAEARSGHVVMHEGLFYKPHEFAVSGDGDLFVDKMRWHTWGGRKAVGYGQVIEQERPSHVDHFYFGRVTLSDRTYCANLHRTVYNRLVVRILGRSAGVFKARTSGRVYTCAGTWQLT